MLHAVANVSLEEVIDAFMREKTKVYGQSQMAKLIGTKRQGVNAIMNHKDGRRFNMGHLSRFADGSGAPMSQLLAELAKLAWQQESELLGGSATSSWLPQPKLLPGAKEERPPGAVDELAGLLARVLDELNRRR